MIRSNAAKNKKGKNEKRIDRNATNVGAMPFGSPKQLSDGGTKTSLVQRVYETIMEALDAGELKPGSRIIAAELAQRLGLSRAPVREALAVLAGQGLVELLADRGAILRPMTKHDMAGVYEVGSPVVALGLKGAALRIHEGDNAARVTAAMEVIRVAAKEGAPRIRFFLVLNDFHRLINGIAEMPYVDFVMRALNVEYWDRLLASTIDMNLYADQYVRNYQRMTDAVLAGDPRSAEAVMLHHGDWCASLLKGD